MTYNGGRHGLIALINSPILSLRKESVKALAKSGQRKAGCEIKI
jgi:hypothetical protein